VDAFVAPSAYLAARVRPVLRGARVVHVPNPLPVAPLDPGPRAGVLFAGRLVEEKGVLDVLAIARLLADVPFTVLGDGPLRGAVKAAGLANVSAPGAVSGAELAAALRRAAVVLVPSRWPENDPYAVTEAQAAGAVVVASAIGGIPGQVRSGEDGVLCSPASPPEWASAVRAVLTAPEEAARIGVRGHERVRSERDPARTAIALESLYLSVRSPARSLD
jgi:glycosyltransferase involved in cell wall biosynthesis